jgi:hypothetical protein
LVLPWFSFIGRSYQDFAKPAIILNLAPSALAQGDAAAKESAFRCIATGVYRPPLGRPETDHKPAVTGRDIAAKKLKNPS